MSYVEPSPSKIKTRDTGLGIEITIPAKKNWFAILFIGFWLIAWAVALFFVSATLINSFIDNASESSGFGWFGRVFTIAWLGGWTVGGFFALKSLLWMIAGKETILVTYDGITIGKHRVLYTSKKEYSRSHIKEIRTESGAQGWYKGFNVFGQNTGLIAFDYGAKTIKFGICEHEAEAKYILETIKKRFSIYFEQSK